MYRGRYEGRYSRAGQTSAGKRRRGKRLLIPLISAMLFLMAAVGATIAWMSTRDTPIQNTFIPSHVSCEVTEKFDAETGVKSSVNVKNTGDTTAYIRVKLITYRTNDQGQHIGGAASIPTFSLGENWVEYGGYYYYTLPVAPGAYPETNLADSLQLTTSYTDADGGRQAMDVMAEAIQSVPEQAAGTAWGVRISQGSVTAYDGTGESGVSA